MVAMIMVRVLRRDVQKYNERHDLSEEDRQEKYEEETGWKLIHGDVFRPPDCAGWFSVLAGTGVQVFFMTVILLVFACLGFLSPANRGGLMTALPLLFVFSGAFAGYASTRLYLSFSLSFWKTNTLRTAILFPAYVGLIFFCSQPLFMGSQVFKRSSLFDIGGATCFMALYFGSPGLHGQLLSFETRGRGPSHSCEQYKT